MVGEHDKRGRAALFRDRLAQALAASGLSRAALARAVGVDRSTVTQLLAPGATRLPNAQVAAECALALGVSADWLLGLSDRREGAAELIAATVQMTEAPRALIDDYLFALHQEAAGYKVRHVPVGLPDVLKTDAVLMWEAEPSLGRTTEQAIGAARDRLDWMRQGRSDTEIALPIHEVEAFAHGEGYYHGLPEDVRREQLDRMRALHQMLYPTLRVHLFDAHRLWSAPLTVFGPLIAVVYLGRHHLAFRDTERVGAITRHFDALVRDAAVPSREFGAWLGGL